MSDSRLDQLYLDHLRTVVLRTDRSLAATGFDALVIQAGTPPTQFLDDQCIETGGGQRMIRALRHGP